MVILRCLGPEQFFLERVVFPFELLSFSCPRNSEIEIWTHSLGGPEMVETFPSGELLMEPASTLDEPGEDPSDEPSAGAFAAPLQTMPPQARPWAAAS